jgi:hypothetical protein
VVGDAGEIEEDGLVVGAALRELGEEALEEGGLPDAAGTDDEVVKKEVLPPARTRPRARRTAQCGRIGRGVDRGTKTRPLASRLPTTTMSSPSSVKVMSSMVSALGTP